LQTQNDRLLNEKGADLHLIFMARPHSIIISPR